MFHSATLKLTAWYLAILVAISLLFSIIIYTIASSEIDTRIGYLERNARPGFIINQNRFEVLRSTQVREAEMNLIASLVITNVFIWVAGGIGSYYLARRSLTPIEEAHEAQSRFTSDASHELRTPLASMKTEIEVALRDPNITNQEMRGLLTSNLEEVNKLANLSQNLLQLSRLEHDGFTLEHVELTALAKTVAKQLDKSDARIAIEGEQHIVAHGNTSSLEELMTILLDNALKYSPADSQIQVRFVQPKRLIGFAITNEGDGIPAEVLPHIFDRFYRADSSRTSDSKKGYGLGLSLAKKIVELNHGELTVTSGKNQATTFQVLLPRFSKDKAKTKQ